MSNLGSIYHQHKAELSTGIKYPFQFYAGSVATSAGEQHIKESVLQILGTSKYEYLMKPEFGCNIHERVFDPINAMALVETDIREAIAEFEPRVKSVSVDVDTDQSSEGLIKIRVGMVLKGEEEPTSISFSVRS